jgi:hypothetical protein
MKHLHFLAELLARVLQVQRNGARDVAPYTAGDAKTFSITYSVADLHTKDLNIMHCNSHGA